MSKKKDLRQLYHESKKEREGEQTHFERALEGVVCNFPSKTSADQIITKNQITNKNQ